MDLSPILNPLNDAQREAVTAPLGAVLVLAGAGSGKTRVLTHRIAWVIQAEGASPHGLDESRWVPREILYFINGNKDEGLRPKDLKDNGDPTRRMFIKLYKDYEELCQRAGVVDFAELLLRAFELFRDNDALLAHYQHRFRHVLVDEFQDTNAIQYNWMKLLASSQVCPFVVGDDDQSIYRWRGARVENLHQYRRDFPHARL